jgi:hypothetical protein
MPKYKTPAIPRAIAYKEQQGRCYYCRSPMWLTDLDAFRARYGLTKPLALQLKCTAEHLQARSEGGTNARENIAAACWLCNQRRHQRRHPPCAEKYRSLVQQRIARGRWHCTSLLSRVGRLL